MIVRREVISRDPIEEKGGINLYGYVRNNPVNWLDVLGKGLFKPFKRKVNSTNSVKPYGNWCGKGWCGGTYPPPGGTNWNVPAIDSIDQCCKEHDWCVQKASNNWWDKTLGECKRVMCLCLRTEVNECDAKNHRGIYRLMKLFFCLGEPAYAE